MTDAVGREFSVFNHAVRTFRPGFDPERDEPSNHPVALPATIESWANRGPAGFRRFLFLQALRDSVSSGDLEAELPSFTTVKGIAAGQEMERARAEGRSDTELLELALEDNAQLNKRISEQESQYLGLLGDMDLVGQEGDEAKAEVNRLRARIAHLEHALSRSEIPEVPEIPVDFDCLEDWSNTYLAGSIVLLNRAIRAARKSSFENTPLAYQALLLLRDHYVPMRRKTGGGSREEYDKALQKLGLEDAPTFSTGLAGEHGDEYFVVFEGRRRELDRHLKGSNVRDGRYGFRLYYFWDAESQQVIVGWLPSHLTTRAS